MAQNKFFLSREKASSPNAPEKFYFASNLPRTLSIADAAELRDTLTALLAEPKKSNAAETEQKKLGAFLLANFKNETGNETPEACAIRLLGKKAKN